MRPTAKEEDLQEIVVKGKSPVAKEERDTIRESLN